MRKSAAVLFAVVFCVSCAGMSFAQEKTAEKSAPAKSPAAPAMSPAKVMPGKPMPRSNFIMLYGSITKIDSSDPANVKLEVKNEADNTTHTVEVTPSTNITKATDASELKTGENIRVMARKADDKVVAMGVMFGKIKKLPPRPASPAGAPVMPPKAPAAPKK
jgi:hypothetical protein